MALKSPVLAEQKTTSTGSVLTLIAAESGKASFASQMSALDTCVYGLAAANGDWEFGIGELTTTSTFTRAVSPFLSSNANAPIVLSAGTQTVRCIKFPAFEVPDANNMFDFNGGYLNNHIPHFLSTIDADTATTTVDFAGLLVQKHHVVITMITNSTLSLSNYPWTAGGQYAEVVFVIKQDSTGGWALTLPASFTATANSPALVTTANAINIIDAVTFDGGINWSYSVR